MRGTCGVVALMLAITGVACSAKPKHVLTRPETQEWDLAPDVQKYSDPPTYPAQEKKAPEEQKGVPGGFGGGPNGGGGGGSPFSGGGVGGVH